MKKLELSSIMSFPILPCNVYHDWQSTWILQIGKYAMGSQVAGEREKLTGTIVFLVKCNNFPEHSKEFIILMLMFGWDQGSKTASGITCPTDLLHSTCLWTPSDLYFRCLDAWFWIQEISIDQDQIKWSSKSLWQMLEDNKTSWI